ncbi:iron-sulfur cluster assembly scaffold protein [Telmatospirillum sp.]|uniref:iron-sulfur cluster assembly scaffold protein n=1 Tax=Telmatospirillum sp. TaxID=2079197 RepID=UPI00284D1F9A|nr:iron-sulfur cluster assembly scaffold protein [Telmatospirillum sp.]MDR3437778.1 iron-sulfur cluster assembly scaffold protein [Telmatospirillum sp.]
MTEQSLYQEQVKALAHAAHGAGRLSGPDGHAVQDNPLCGDRVDIDIKMASDGTIAALGHDIRGCLLCQASASGLAAAAPGLRPQQITEARQAIERMLHAVDATSDSLDGMPAFAAFTAFLPVHRSKSRHACILLPFLATEKALEMATGTNSTKEDATC